MCVPLADKPPEHPAAAAGLWRGTSLSRKGAKMVLYNVRPEIHDVFKVSRNTQLIPIADDEGPRSPRRSER